MKKIIFKTFVALLETVFIFSFFPEVQSQPTVQWVKRYNGTGNDEDWANAIKIDNSGNVYVTGWSIGTGTREDYYIIKYNHAGVQQWALRYNGPQDSTDQSWAIAVDNSGNVYVTGQSKGSGSDFDYCTIKCNSSGLISFVQRYNGPGNGDDRAFSIAIDNSGNIYVTGYSKGVGTSRDYCTIKYNSSGVQQWASRYNGPENANDAAYSIAVDNSGNIYVTGQRTTSWDNYDICTIKYNSSGAQQWVRTILNSGDFDGGTAIVVDSLNNVYVTGCSDHNYCTIKYNTLGVQQWIETAVEGEQALSIAVDYQGNAYVTGLAIGSSGYDYCTIKYNSLGVQQWLKTYIGPGNGDDNANSIAVDNSGNVYVTGRSRGIGTYDDYCTIKYNSSGLQKWEQRYNGPENNDDVSRSIAVDNSGNIYVTGYSTGSGTDVDYCTIKYHEPIGIHKISSEVPTSCALHQNYPNPFNPATHFGFQIADFGFIKVTIFDILGGEVAVLVNEQLQPGTYEVEWNAVNYPSGIYYYRLITENFTETKKMILIK